MTLVPRARTLALLGITIACVWLSVARLSLSGDLTALFPDRGAAAGLTRFTRAFGGTDVATILVQGESPGDVKSASEALARALAEKPTVARVATRVKVGGERGEGAELDPTLAWAFADPVATRTLALALTPDGMRARLDGTRAMLLAPGASEAEPRLARDPLRLAEIPWEAETELAAGLVPSADGSFVTGDGRARLVVAQPRGSAFDSRAAAAFVHDADDAMDAAALAFPGVRASLAGGHAIACATEAMIRRDLEVSGSLSLVLASIAFLVTFRRARALVAVLPPLVAGTIWTVGVVAVVSPGLSAISIGFMAVVVGVGVDTGVHVYAALLEARREGLPPREAARVARARAARPTLLAATAAGLAFASLAISDLVALRQLGVLCALGEVLTAVAILLMTPDIGALLERGAPPARQRPIWIEWLARVLRSKRAAGAALVLALLPIVAVGVLGWPRAGEAVVALRPKALAPLAVQDEIYRLFGGERGQWIVLVGDADDARARARADRVADALATLRADGAIGGFDALTTIAPAPETQRERLRARDALDLPSLAPRLAEALADRGFDARACAGAIDALRAPSSAIAPMPGPTSDLGWIVARHVARDADGTLVALYVRPRGDPAGDARAADAIHAADSAAIITGFGHLETALKASLARDLPRVALLALVLVAITLRAALGRVRDVVLAVATVAVEIAIVAVAMRVFHMRWHVYDALVLPVLVGITIDEAMFLLHAARSSRGDGGDAVDHALRAQGPLVAATALTTAAGFAALLACRFDGLRDVGGVGAIGSIAGLVCALVLVPAGLRVTERPPPRVEKAAGRGKT